MFATGRWQIAPTLTKCQFGCWHRVANNLPPSPLSLTLPLCICAPLLCYIRVIEKKGRTWAVCVCGCCVLFVCNSACYLHVCQVYMCVWVCVWSVCLYALHDRSIYANKLKMQIKWKCQRLRWPSNRRQTCSLPLSLSHPSHSRTQRALRALSSTRSTHTQIANQAKT